MAQMCTYFKTETDVAQNLIDDFFLTLTVRGPFYRKNFKWKKNMEVRGSFLKIGKLWMQIVILQHAIFYNIYFLSLWLRIIRRSDQGIKFMNFRSQILFNGINHGYRAAILKKNSLWLLPFYMAVATYCCYEKVRRTMGTAIVSYLLKYGWFYKTKT